MKKIFCAYCGYANGLVNCWVKISAETEKYWCEIKHQDRPGAIDPAHHSGGFAAYGEREEFEEKYKRNDIADYYFFWLWPMKKLEKWPKAYLIWPGSK